MNGLIETGLVDVIKCGNNFAYILNDNNAFSSTEYKVLQSQKDGSFVKCMKLLYNGKVQLYYLTDGLKSLMSMLTLLDAESFMTVVASLFADIIEVNNNGFLSCQNIDVSFEHIFVNPATYKTSLVYLPIAKKIYNDSSMFENELRANLIKVIQSVASLSAPKTMQLAVDLSNGTLSLETLYTKIKGEKLVEKNMSAGFVKEISKVNEKMKLVAINAPVSSEITVTKDEFILGKKQELVDGVISFNRMVSRTHCKITRNGKQYAITDLNSANGTYVNKVRLQPGQPCPVKNGDTIRLANSEFQVIIG